MATLLCRREVEIFSRQRDIRLRAAARIYARPRAEIERRKGGEIESQVERSFTVDIGGRVSSITWDRQAANITIEGVPGDSSRPTTVIACSEIAARSIMVFWKPLN